MSTEAEKDFDVGGSFVLERLEEIKAVLAKMPPGDSHTRFWLGFMSAAAGACASGIGSKDASFALQVARNNMLKVFEPKEKS